MILNALGAIAIIIAVIYTAMNDSSGVINPLSIIFPILLFIVIISNVIFNILYIRSIKGCVLIARDSLANKTKKRKSNAIFASVMIIIKSFIEFGPTLALALGTAVVNDTVSSLNMNVNGSEFNYLIDQYVNATTGILISRLIQLFANIVLVIILISYHKELNKELKVENQNDLYNDFL